MPPIRHAAVPVMPTTHRPLPSPRSLTCCMTFFRMKDLPTPAEPVMKMLRPSLTESSTCCCSAESASSDARVPATSSFGRRVFVAGADACAIFASTSRLALIRPISTERPICGSARKIRLSPYGPFFQLCFPSRMSAMESDVSPSSTLATHASSISAASLSGSAAAAPPPPPFLCESTTRSSFGTMKSPMPPLRAGLGFCCCCCCDAVFGCEAEATGVWCTGETSCDGGCCCSCCLRVARFSSAFVLLAWIRAASASESEAALGALPSASEVVFAVLSSSMLSSSMCGRRLRSLSALCALCDCERGCACCHGTRNAEADHRCCLYVIMAASYVRPGAAAPCGGARITLLLLGDVYPPSRGKRKNATP